MTICKGVTKAGKPCRATVMPGKDVCSAHGGTENKPGRPNERALVATILEAAKTEWRAAAWILERRFPERWRRGGGDAPVEEGFDSLDELSRRRDARRSGL